MISLTRIENKLKVATPYNDDWVYYAKHNGGRWDAANQTWNFSLNAEEGVKRVLLDIFGWVEGEELKQLLVRIRASMFEEYNQIKVGSTILAYRLAKKSKVYFNGDAAVVSGRGFPSKGGSMSCPKCDPYDDTVIQATISQHDYDILSDTEKKFIEIVDVETEQEERMARLKAEKERLLARLEAIEKELTNTIGG